MYILKTINCVRSFDLSIDIREQRPHHVNRYTIEATAKIWYCGNYKQYITVNVSSVDNCFLLTILLKCLIKLHEFIIILVWSFLYAHARTRLRRRHDRVVRHARIRVTDIVGGATAMSFGKKIRGPASILVIQYFRYCAMYSVTWYFFRSPCMLSLHLFFSRPLLLPETSSLIDFAQMWLQSRLKQWPKHLSILFSRKVSTGFTSASFLVSSFLM